MRIADIFCGTGGLSHGFLATGEFETALGIDIKKDAVATFAANNPKALALSEDIRALHVAEIAEDLGLGRGDLELIVGGPPCQGFSSLRPYRSINENDPRNTLFEQLMLYVGFFRPRWVVLENVVGLLQHRKGETINSIRSALDSLGFAATVGVLNGVNFGLPQRRERVFVLARAGRIKPKLPDHTHWFDGKSMAGRHLHEPLAIFSESLEPAVTVMDAIGDLPPVAAGEGATSYLPAHRASAYARDRRKATSLLTLHEATAHTARMLEIIRHAGTNRWALPEGMTTSGFSSCYSRLDAAQPATTITVNFVHPASNRCIHPQQDRALTPREGARLQGFDDDFEFCGTRTQIVKQIGEAVPPVVSRAIAGAVLSQWD